MKKRFAITALMVATTFANASSTDAWAKLFSTAKKVCIQSSGLRHARSSNTPIDFADKVMVVVKGFWPQPHMKGAPAMLICLYDKRDGRAEIREAPPRRDS